MKRRKKSKISKKAKNLNIMLAIICVLIFLVVIFSPVRECQDKYKMELYIKTPENNEIKVRECEGLNPDINCGTFYTNYFCSSKGTYFGKAVTRLNGRILSTSDWLVLPDLCK